jgi:hypothetical protein
MLTANGSTEAIGARCRRWTSCGDRVEHRVWRDRGPVLHAARPPGRRGLPRGPQLLHPDARVVLLDRGKAPVGLFQPGVVLDVRQRAVHHGAVYLVAPVGQITIRFRRYRGQYLASTTLGG